MTRESWNRSLELNLDRGVLNPETIHSGLDDTVTRGLPRRWELRDGRAMLRSTNPELDDDDDKWKFVPYIGAVLLFFSWIAQSWTRRVTKGKVASLKFEPNALRSIGSVNGEERRKPYGASPPGLDKFGAAFSIAGEPQQKVADE